ncbi:MAG TPA: hypothetical protein VFQ61_08850 [Polyangiaceae bacterium]|nr:hypothetical protein [Polyangiaceae bacterium]
MSDTSKLTQPDLDGRWLSADAQTALAVAAEAGARAAALVDAWVKAGNAAAVATLADRGEGAARKAARRGLNVLKSRGIRVEAPPRVVPVAGDAREPELQTEAWMVPPDAEGNTLIVLASRTQTSRAQSAFITVRDSAFVLGVNVGELSGSRLKEALKRAAQGAEPVRITPEYARFRIAEARKQQKQLGIPEPLGTTSAQKLLEPVPSGPVPHPLENEGLELSEEDCKELAGKSGALHGLREFQPWLPDRSSVEEMLREVGRKLPRENGQPKEEAIEPLLTECVAEATDRYFIPERRRVLVDRLKDCALSVLAREGEVRALELVAVIKEIEKAGLITDPPRDIPFLRAFFEKAVAMLAMRGGGRLQIPLSGPGPDGASEATASGGAEGASSAQDSPAQENPSGEAAASSTETNG